MLKKIIILLVILVSISCAKKEEPKQKIVDSEISPLPEDDSGNIEDVITGDGITTDSTTPTTDETITDELGSEGSDIESAIKNTGIQHHKPALQ